MSSWKDFNKQNNDTVTLYEVDVTNLDEETAEVGPIDILWVDVQGAEMHVLKGGPKALINTKAVFLEVALCDSPYEQGANFYELNALLHDSGHVLTLLGIDPWNYTGNALWIQRQDSLALK